ncbi:SDR family NAD(P)-dependent oxidoreductase [Streptomyces sp. NPDC058045]|uniref:SDR family NAD(P)-dependent oxidoreductase n=1 Tax=Streptomyces sp. NPDC058045 TaxID=3346311 RepID=UPI0036EC7423
MRSESGITSGRSVLITEGHRETCQGIAAALQEHGDRVAATYTDSRPAVPALSFPCDVTSPADVERALTGVEELHGPVEVLVASISLSNDMMLRSADERFVSVCDNHLIGSFRLIRAALAGMRETGHGRVIFLNTEHPAELPRRYGASEAALNGFISTVVREEARYGITCNVVTVSAPRRTAWGEPPQGQLRDQQVSAAVLAPMFSPQAQAAAETVKFLAAESAGTINGANIPVDRGFRMVS